MVPLALQLFQCSVTHNKEARKEIVEMWDDVWNAGVAGLQALAPGGSGCMAVMSS